MMIYLNDINESGDGAFECIHVVQKIARDRFRSWFKENSVDNEIIIGSDKYYNMIKTSTRKEEIPPVIDIYGRAGTLIIFSSDCYHRGGILNKKKTRKIIRGHTFPGKMLCSGDIIKMGSNNWLRDET